MPINDQQLFDAALARRAPTFGVALDDETRARLGEYYTLLQTWNPRLHLVAPCSPEEFATRHVLESLLLLPRLTHAARVLDVGSGGGLPVIPCLVARRDVSATLYEASAKKCVFLREALTRLNLRAQGQVVNERFERTSAPDAEFVTCRALERFAEMLPPLIAWSPHASTLLLFGGASLREKIEALNLRAEAVLAPSSEQRYLFVVEREG